MQPDKALPRPPDLRKLCAAGPIALFLDFDGTLVDLATTPDGIDVPSSLAGALHSLSDELDGRLALVSGRAIVDLEKHLGSLWLARAGSHGSDCRLADGTSLGDPPQELSSSALEEIAEFAAKALFSLEDKPHGAALHYRHDPSLESKGLDFATKFADKHLLDVKRGKCVIELVAPGANKGSAVESFMKAKPFAGSTPIFVGDDVTDEDGFAAAARLGGFGILIGERNQTAARYGLADPANVKQWLDL